LHELKNTEDVKQAIITAYKVTDDQIKDKKIDNSGSTAVSALITINPDNEKYLYTANCGDARAVLG
jgi:serine/threonine protein phosphatase PrpC